MNTDNKKDTDLREIAKGYKPRLFDPIFISIVCIAPYLHLVVDVLEKNYDRLLSLTLMSAPLISLITYFWTRYFYQMREYNVEVSNYLNNPDKYEW